MKEIEPGDFPLIMDVMFAMVMTLFYRTEFVQLSEEDRAHYFVELRKRFTDQGFEDFRSLRVTRMIKDVFKEMEDQCQTTETKK